MDWRKEKKKNCNENKGMKSLILIIFFLLSFIVFLIYMYIFDFLPISMTNEIEILNFLYLFSNLKNKFTKLSKNQFLKKLFWKENVFS